MFQKFKVLILSWNLVPELLGICKVWWWCSFFCFELLSASFLREICWHFDVIWLISQQFTLRDMKPMAFLVLSCKAVLHTETWSQWLFLFYHVKLFYTLLFIFFYFKPLVTPLFIHLFSVLFFFWSKRPSHFHTLNIYRQVLREFLQFRNVQWVVIISHKCLIIT